MALPYYGESPATWLSKLKLIKWDENRSFSSPVTLVTLSAHKPHMGSGFHTGQCSSRTFPSPQGVLLDSAGLGQALSLFSRPTCLSLSFLFSWNYKFLLHTPKLFTLWTGTWSPNVQSWFTCSLKEQVNSTGWFMVDGIHGGNYKTDLEYTSRLGDLEAIVRLRVVPHICFYGAHLNQIYGAPFIHPLGFHRRQWDRGLIGQCAI